MCLVAYREIMGLVVRWGLHGVDSSSSGTQWGLPARGFGPGKGKEFLLRHRACSAADDKVGRRWEGRGARCLLGVALARHGDTLVAFSG